MKQVHAAVTLLLMSAARLMADETIEGPRLDRAAVLALVEAKDVHSLDRTYKRLRPNAALDVLYRSLRLRMQPGSENEEALLKTVPKTFEEYVLYLALEDPSMGTKAVTILSEVVDGYYERVARLTVSHHGSFEPYLRLHSFTDGYARTDSQEWLEWLFEKDRDAFRSCFQALDSDTKRGICGDDCATYEAK